MAKYLLQEHDDAEVHRKRASRNPFTRFQLGFETGFERFRHGYLRLLTFCVDHSGLFLILFLVFAAGVARAGAVAGAGLLPIGRFRPVHDSCARAHRHAHRGDGCPLRPYRGTIRQQIPADELVTILDNIGLPYSSLNLSYSVSAPVGSIRCRHPGAIEPEASSHRGLCRAAARRACPRLPRRDVL